MKAFCACVLNWRTLKKIFLIELFFFVLSWRLFYCCYGDKYFLVIIEKKNYKYKSRLCDNNEEKEERKGS